MTFTLPKAGTAAFVLRYRHQGKQREISIGRYPDMSLEEARHRAAELRKQVADGVDAAREKQRKKPLQARASTFGALAEDCMARVAPALRESTRGETRRYLDKDILPRLGALSLPDLGRRTSCPWPKPSRPALCNNVLAGTIIGLYKTEVIHPRSSWRHPDAVE